jgi:hypothetical protein
VEDGWVPGIEEYERERDEDAAGSSGKIWVWGDGEEGKLDGVKRSWEALEVGFSCFRWNMEECFSGVQRRVRREMLILGCLVPVEPATLSTNQSLPTTNGPTRATAATMTIPIRLLHSQTRKACGTTKTTKTKASTSRSDPLENVVVPNRPTAKRPGNDVKVNKENNEMLIG